MAGESIFGIDANATPPDERVDHEAEPVGYASGMRPVSDIRRDRLLELIKEHAEGNAAAFGRLIGKSRAQIGFWTAKPGKPGAKNLGSTTARALEKQFMKPNGWMDSDSATSLPSQPTIPDAEIMTDAEIMVRGREVLHGPYEDLEERGRQLALAYTLLVKHSRSIPPSAYNEYLLGGVVDAKGKGRGVRG